MALLKVIIKNNRHIAIDTGEIIALDFNESLKDIKIHLRGGSFLEIEGKKAAKIWKQLAKDLPDLIHEDGENMDFEDLP